MVNLEQDLRKIYLEQDGITLEQRQLLENLKKNNKIIMYTGGTFDLFHDGHLNLLKRARDMGDFLVVAVSTDELVASYKERPVVSYEGRCNILKGLRCVGLVVKQNQLFDVDQFNRLMADYFAIGDDWINNKEIPGLNWLRDNGKVIFFPYTKGLSTTEIKDRIVENVKRSEYEKIRKSGKY